VPQRFIAPQQKTVCQESSPVMQSKDRRTIMRQAAQHIAVKYTVNWMGLAPSLTAGIQAGENAFGIPSAAKTAG
jgi:hypothetical protein